MSCQANCGSGFADDVKLYSCVDIGADSLSLQNHLSLLYMWSLGWQFDIFPTECVNLSLIVQLKIHVIQSLNNGSSVTELGVVVGQYLNFEPHDDHFAS